MKIIAYRLEPVYEIAPGNIATAAVMTCMVTGEYLSGMGGGGDYISPKVYSRLREEAGRERATKDYFS
jgi:CTP-dependent riboflavin kinase